jgi:hypothetical protein
MARNGVSIILTIKKKLTLYNVAQCLKKLLDRLGFSKTFPCTLQNNTLLPSLWDMNHILNPAIFSRVNAEHHCLVATLCLHKHHRPFCTDLLCGDLV